MNNHARLLLLLLTVLCAPAVRADEGKVDSFVRAELDRRKIPGASIAVVREGKVVLARGYGLANVEHAAPAGQETVYQLASVTKQFTAAAVMILAADGKLSLDAPVSKHVSSAPPAWSKVTVRHLLNHTSGIKSYTSLPSLAKEPRRDYAQDELIGLVRDLPLDFPPGEKWAYNNTGYYLLGMIIEKAGGKSYDEFLTERIFRPLGMSSSRLNLRQAVIPRRADGYGREGTGLRRADFVSPTQPFAAGALLSTVQDLAKWDAALYTDRPLPRSIREEMWTATTLTGGGKADYGYGWAVGETNGHRTVEHGGGILGFSTQITRFPELRLTVIVLTNLEGGHAGALASGIAAIYDPALKPKAGVAIEDKDLKTTERIRKLLLSLGAGKAEPEEFAPELRAFLFPDRVKQAQELFASLGELKKLELLDSRQEDGTLRRRYRATFGASPVVVEFGIDKEGKIAGARVMPE